jgi:acetyl-CoA carboxylase biotin carboxyl carrier protein
MDIKEIQNLIRFVSQHSVDEVEIVRKDFKLVIKKSAEQVVVHSSPAQLHQVAPAPVPQTASAPVAPAAPAVAVEAVSDKSENLITIKSPMIGTFYRTPGPDKPNFVNVGDEIKTGQVVCIIEAMKLFNEIESEVSGRIVKILVDGTSPVEYDQPLFLVEPA